MKVIVFALRSCPVAALGPYGNEWIATPNLDQFAAESVVFDHHFSDCPDPNAAGRAWRTGQLQTPPISPSSNRVKPHHNTDLLALLKAKSVRTILVRNTRETNDSHADFYAGWDELFDARPATSDLSPTDALIRVLPAVLEKYSTESDWLLWIEIDRFLPPWNVPQDVFDVYIEDLIENDEEEVEEDDEETDDMDQETDEAEIEEVDSDSEQAEAEPVRPWVDPPMGWFDRDDLASWELLHRSFATAVTVFDADLKKVCALLRNHNLDKTAAWVMTSDRGLPLGEHGLIGFHRPWLHEELVHLPLIMRLPNAAEAGRRVPALTQPADLMPTILNWFNAEQPAISDGASLLPLIQGSAESLREHACMGLILGEAGEWAIRTRHWFLILPERPHPDDDERREPMLFEKPDDRWEVSDLRPRHLERAEELETMLRSAIESPVTGRSPG